MARVGTIPHTLETIGTAHLIPTALVSRPHGAWAKVGASPSGSAMGTAMAILITTIPGGGPGATTAVAVGGRLGAMDMVVMPALMFMDGGATQPTLALVPPGQIQPLEA